MPCMFSRDMERVIVGKRSLRHSRWYDGMSVDLTGKPRWLRVDWDHRTPRTIETDAFDVSGEKISLYHMLAFWLNSNIPILEKLYFALLVSHTFLMVEPHVQNVS